MANSSAIAVPTAVIHHPLGLSTVKRTPMLNPPAPKRSCSDRSARRHKVFREYCVGHMAKLRIASAIQNK
jgi:hypothetical protein